MDVATLDKQIAALRDDDGSIAQALSDLDTTLATWLTVMLKGQAAMLARVRRNGSPAEDAPTIEREETVDPQPKQPDSPGSRLFQGSLPSTVDLEHEPPISETPIATPGDATVPPGDEELLASLDMETANVIRVKRRLSNNAKSVRELLDELGLEHSPSKGANPRRSRWWRKDNE